MTVAQSRMLPSSPRSAAYQATVAIPGMALIALTLIGHGDAVQRADFWFWTLAVLIVEVIPVPAWGGLQLSLGFPILLAVAILYPPGIAALIALIASVDPREFRHEVSFLKATFNRTQMALSILAGSAIFQALASSGSRWYILVPVVLLAAIISYGINTLLVAILTAVDRELPVPQVLAKMHGAAPYEFLISYLGLGLFGAVIARFYINEGFWSVAVFLAPLVFARQMYFRSRALADRLAEQNTLLADQAERLETLLHKEHENVSELRELNRMKGEFVAVVSHELRTPVTALIGYAKTLRQPEFAEDAQMRAEFLERMERQGDRLLRLVENLLTASNLENRKLPASIGRVLFDDLCREIVEGLGSDAERIELDLPPSLPVLHTDRQLLGRVLSNLIDNALKYSPEDTSCIVGARKENEGIVFWVQDQGIGIEESVVKRVFEPFYQVDSSPTRAFRGTGLGLSLVKDLLDHLGGTVELESTVGEGSTFTVHLSVWHPASDGASQAGRQMSEDAVASEESGRS